MTRRIMQATGKPLACDYQKESCYQNIQIHIGPTKCKLPLGNFVRMTQLNLEGLDL